MGHIIIVIFNNNNDITFANIFTFRISFQTDPGLEGFRRELIVTAARALDKAHMIRFVEHSGDLNATDLGRTASHFYIQYATIETFNEMLKPLMSEGEVFGMVSQAQEFEQIKVGARIDLIIKVFVALYFS